MAADVDDVGTFGDKGSDRGNDGVEGMDAPVGEGVWGEVKDSHDKGGTVRIRGIKGGQMGGEVDESSEWRAGGWWGWEGGEVVDEGGRSERVRAVGGDAGLESV